MGYFKTKTNLVLNLASNILCLKLAASRYFRKAIK